MRRHQLGLPAGSHMGNGADWADTARRLGYWVDSTPRVGDVICFQRGQYGSDPFYGHVGIVESVASDGSITTSECGAAYNGQPFSRTFTAEQAKQLQSSTTRKDIPLKDEKLEAVAKEVFLSIPPDVRTGVFIDVFTPCDWHHAARCMVDYAGILDDPREPFNLVCDMPVICTTTVTEKTVVSDVRPLAYLPDEAFVYMLVVDMEMDCVEVDVEKNGIVYVENRPDAIGQAYADLADDLNDAVSESEKFALYDSLNAVYQFAYRLSELTQRHLVLERSRTWKLAE